MGFCSFFRSQAVLSWKISEDSPEFISFFESAIQDDKELRKAYMNLKERHKDWTFKEIIFSLIDSIDGIRKTDFTYSFGKLAQGVKESISSFASRFLDAAEAYRVFAKLSERE
jgi:hypothetical protein